MQFHDFLSPQAIVPDLVSTTKKEAIAEIADALIKTKLIKKNMRESVLTALLDREELGSTGIGQGIAIPHAKHPDVKSLVGLFARSREGVEFQALDGEPVHLFFLLLSNQESADLHLQALAHVSTQLRNDIFRRFLLKARDGKEIKELLDEADQKG